MGNKDCAPENSICISKKCYCKPNYVSMSIDSCIPGKHSIRSYKKNIAKIFIL